MKKKYLLLFGVAAIIMLSMSVASPVVYAATNFYWTGYGAIAHWKIPIMYNGQPAAISITAILIDAQSYMTPPNGDSTFSVLSIPSMCGRTNLYISAVHPSAVGNAYANFEIGPSDFSTPGGIPTSVQTLATFNFGPGVTEKHLIQITWNYQYPIYEPNTAFIGIANGLMASFSEGTWYPCIAYLRIDAGTVVHPGWYFSDGAIDGWGTWDVKV